MASRRYRPCSDADQGQLFELEECGSWGWVKNKGLLGPTKADWGHTSGNCAELWPLGSRIFVMAQLGRVWMQVGHASWSRLDRHVWAEVGPKSIPDGPQIEAV